MHNRSGQRLWGRGDNQQESLTEMSDFSPSVSVGIPKRIQIWDVTQELIFGVRQTYNLIESTCFYLNVSRSMCLYLKISRVHFFGSNFSQVRMFCDDDCSTLVLESTQPGVFLGRMILDNLFMKTTDRKSVVFMKIGSS